MTPEQARGAARAAVAEMRSPSVRVAGPGAQRLCALIVDGFTAEALDAVPALVAAARRPPPLRGVATDVLACLLVKHQQGVTGLDDDAADRIVEAGVLGPLVSALSATGDAETARVSALALSNIVTLRVKFLGDPGMRRRSAAAIAAGAVPKLVGALRRRGALDDHQDAVISAIANIAIMGGDEIVAAGAIAEVCAVAPACGTLVSAVTCLANIAQDKSGGGDFGADPGLEARRDALCDAACLAVLVGAAGSGDAHTAGNALRCLSELVQRGSRYAGPDPGSVADATDARRGAALVAAGAEKAFVAALSSKALRLGRGMLPPACIAAESLALLAFCGSDGAEAAVVEAGAFKALAKCLKRKQEAVVASAVGACRYFAALGTPSTRTALFEVMGPVSLSATSFDKQIDMMVAQLSGHALAGGGGDFGDPTQGAAPAPPPAAADACAHCGARPMPNSGAKLKVCGACKGARYCSLECQKAHWIHGGHRAACAAAVADARGAATPASAP